MFDPSNLPELPSAGIANIHADRQNRLWISTFRGLLVSKPNRWTSLQPQTNWTGNFVRTFSENAGVLCGTSFDGKIFRSHGDRFEELPDPPGVKGSGYLGHVDLSGRIWVAQLEGFFGYWDSPQWIRSAASTLLFPGLENLSHLSDGTMLVVKTNELITLDGEKVITRIPLQQHSGRASDIWSAQRDHTGKYWLCSSSLGVIRIQPSGEMRYFTSTNGLTANTTRFIAEDREQNLWLCSSGGGLLRFKSRNFMTFGPQQGLDERNSWAIVEESAKSMLVGTYGKGIFCFKENNFTRLEPERQPKTGYIQCLLVDKQQNLWIGTYGQGVTRVKADGQKQDLNAAETGRSIKAMFEDSQGRIWIGGELNLTVFTNEQLHICLLPNNVPFRNGRYFAEDPKRGILWHATSDGLFKQESGQWREIKYVSGNSLKDILCLHVGHDGSLWIGGANLGLTRLKDGKWFTINQEQGLISQHVSCLLEDNTGHWWLGSSSGILRTHPVQIQKVMDGSLAELPCQKYDLTDGLASLDCAWGCQNTAAKDSHGRLWFVHTKGITMVDPSKLHLNTNQPPVQLEELSYVNRKGKRIKATTEQVLHAQRIVRSDKSEAFIIPPGSIQFEVRVAALSFTTPEKVRIKYHLLWNGKDFLTDQGSSRTFSSSWLAPGNYQLRVTAANNDGIWNLQGMNVAFIVQPFYWQTLWFQIAIMVLLGGVVATIGYWLHHNRMQKVAAQSQLQQALVEERIRKAAMEELTLSKEALAKAKDSADTANRAKSTFLANMSHEIRTPMNAILGYTQLLQRDKGLNPSHREYVETIHRSGNHLLTLINDILEMSKIEAGRTTLNLSTFNLHSLLNEVNLMFQELCRAKGINLEYKLESNLPRVIEGDAGKIRQIVINLLSNAVKFTQVGGVLLRATAQQEDTNIMISIVVQDTGCGIEADFLDKVFDAFAQSASGAHHGGTGLGMSISRGFARLMSGDLAVKSDVGKGSSFTFTFKAMVQEKHAQSVDEPTSDDADRIKFTSHAKVLIVDDVETNRKLLTEILMPIGLEIHQAASGEEGLQKYYQLNPDIIFMDLRMPGIDGLEATRRIRASGSKVKIVAISASVFHDDAKAAIAAGTDEFIGKPFQLTEILNVLRKHLPPAESKVESTPVIPKQTQTTAQDEAMSNGLENLPDNVKEQLLQASASGDIFRLYELLEGMGVQYPNVASTLRELTAELKFEEINELLQARNNP